MIASAAWRLAILIAVLLTAIPLFSHATWTPAIGHAQLWSPSPSLAAFGVYMLVALSAYDGVARKGNVPAVALFVCALVAAIVDARFAVLFALAAAPLLMQRRIA